MLSAKIVLIFLIALHVATAQQTCTGDRDCPASVSCINGVCGGGFGVVRAKRGIVAEPEVIVGEGRKKKPWCILVGVCFGGD